MSQAARAVVDAVDYQPAASGPFLWQAFDARAIDSDLAAIAHAGFRTVRVGLGWDSFMPEARSVDPRRLTEFESFLRMAARAGLMVVPVLFVQSHGDCVFLPAPTVLRRGARRGVRVFSQGLLEPGGPRDVWTDPLMLEVADRWMRAMVSGFANHPAVAAWDLGDDPASTVRPRKIQDIASWAALMGSPLRRQGDQVHMTLGCADVISARGVRLHTLAPHLDRLDISLRLQQLRPLGLDDASAIVLLAGLAQRLMGETTTRLGLAVALPAGAPEDELEDPAAAGLTDQLIARHEEAGLANLRPIRWSDLGERLAERAPFDRATWMLRCGLTTAGGAEKPALEVWSRALRSEPAPGSPQSWPARLDVDEYYAALPDSLRDLAEAWRRERNNQPAILDRRD